MNTARALMLAAVLVVGLLPTAVSAATFEVDRFDDPDPGAMTCTAAPDDCSLRAAVIAANAAPGADEITLVTGTYTLAIAGAGEDDSLTGDLDVNGDLQVTGLDSVIDVSGLGDRILDVQDGTLDVTGMTLTGGNSPIISPTELGSGGAIRLRGSGAGAVVADSVLTGNTANGDGGAIEVSGPDQTLSISDSDLTDNTTAQRGDGGAIDIRGTGVTVSISGETTLSDNRTVRVGGIGGDGGAIHVDAEDSSLTIGEGVTIRDNTAADDGGGLAVETPSTALEVTLSGVDVSSNFATDEGGAIKMSANGGTTFTVEGSTIADNVAIDGGGVWIAGDATSTNSITATTLADNVATGGGGAIDVPSSELALEVLNATISDNVAPSGSAVRMSGVGTLTHTTVAENGGTEAVRVTDSGSLTLQSSIVSDSTNLNCDGIGTLVDDGGNIDDDGTCAAQTDSPLLQVLALNAPGTTQTHAIPGNSPAIDAGVPAHCPATDQRGVTRPENIACDAGSYEGIADDTPLPPEPLVTDLAIQLVASPDQVVINESSTLTATIQELTGTPADTVTVDISVPTGLSIDDVEASSGTCSAVDGAVQCLLPSVDDMTPATITVAVTGTTIGVLSTTATVSADAPTEAEVANNVASDTITVIQTEVEGERIDGPTRIETAIAGSQDLFGPGEADAVVLARADLFPDSQAGTPLAVQVNGPMLLTMTDQLPAVTAQEILRVLKPGGIVYLLGGVDAIDMTVQDSVEALGFDTIRFGGANRFGTAVIIASLALPDRTLTFAADGSTFPDSVISGAAAASNEGVVVLTDGERLPDETATYLASESDLELVTVGAPATAALPEGDSIVGDGEFDTPVLVARRYFSAPPVIGLATNAAFADALTGGTNVGHQGGPMLLTDPTDLPDPVAAYIEEFGADADRIIIFGGEDAISSSVLDEIREILSP